METPQRGALTLVYFIALTIILLSLLELGLYVLQCRQHQVPVGTLRAVLLFVPILLGFAMLIKSRAIARWISEKLDE